MTQQASTVFSNQAEITAQIIRTTRTVSLGGSYRFTTGATTRMTIGAAGKIFPRNENLCQQSQQASNYNHK